MRPKGRCWTVASVVLVTTSCVSPRSYVDTNHQHLAKGDVAKLNGDYEQNIWYDLFQVLPPETKDSLDFVRLTATKNSKIEARWMHGDETLRKRRLRGRINEDGYFSARTKLFFFTMVFFTKYDSKRSALALTAANDLQVAYCHRDFGLIYVILPFGSKTCKNNLRKRLR